MFALEIRAIRETRAVMAAMNHRFGRFAALSGARAADGGATLPAPFAELLLANRIAGARGRKPPSLLLDLRAGKGRTEVDVLNGAVAATGRSLGVPAPVNAVFARVLSDIAHMPQLWAKYRERPEALQAEVAAEERRAQGAPAAQA